MRNVYVLAVMVVLSACASAARRMNQPPSSKASSIGLGTR